MLKIKVETMFLCTLVFEVWKLEISFNLLCMISNISYTILNRNLSSVWNVSFLSCYDVCTMINFQTYLSSPIFSINRWWPLMCCLTTCACSFICSQGLLGCKQGFFLYFEEILHQFLLYTAIDVLSISW